MCRIEKKRLATGAGVIATVGAILFLVAQIDSIELFIDDLFVFAVFGVTLAVLVTQYIHVTGGSSSRTRLTLGWLLVLLGVSINTSLTEHLRQLRRNWKKNMDAADEWWFNVKMYEAAVQSVKDIGTFGVVAIGAGLIILAISERIQC